MSKPSFDRLTSSLFHRMPTQPSSQPGVQQPGVQQPNTRKCRVASGYASVLALALAGCSSPQNQDAPALLELDSHGAALTAVENTELSLKGIVTSAEFLVDSASLAESWNALSGSSGSCDVATTPACASGTQCAPVDTSSGAGCDEDAVTQADLRQVHDDARKEVDRWVKFLRDKVLIEANLDAAGTTSTQVTYKLGANVLCATEEAPNETSTDEPPRAGVPATSSNLQPAPTPAPSLDPECVAKTTKSSLRLRLTQPRAGDVDATFIVGAENSEPATVQLYHDRIGLKVNLAETLKALRDIGEAPENYEQLTGMLQLQLIKNAALNYSLQLSVLEDVVVKYKSGEDRTSYSLGKSQPEIELSVDGNSKTINARYNAGAISYTAPLSGYVELFGSSQESTAPVANGGQILAPVKKVYTGIVEYFIPAITGKFSYTADSDVFHFSDISLGSSTSFLKWNGSPLASVNLNAAHGRGFSMDVAKALIAGKKRAQISLDPTIDLDAKFNFQLIADQVEGIPDVLLNDTLRAWFEGPNPTLSVEGEQLRMIHGSLHLTSQTHPEANVTVAEGQCAMVNDDNSDAPVIAPSTSTAPPAPMSETYSVFDVQATTCK